MFIKGSIVTIDAMGCQKDIARKIVEEKKADYILSLKENNLLLHEEAPNILKWWKVKTLKIEVFSTLLH